MNDNEFRETALKIKAEVDRAQTILLCCHPGADPDSAGSVLALMHYLRSIGKNVIAIRGDDELSKGLLTLPGAEKILNKNFTEIDNEEFDLFISTDSSSPDQVTKCGEMTQEAKNKTIVVDHHRTNDGYGFINLLIKDSPATAEIVYDLMAVWSVDIDSNIAKCLFAGIYADTGGFKYPMTDSHTFEVASKLVSLVPDFSQVIFNLENSYAPENVKFLGLALSQIETYFSDKVTISPVPFVEMKAKGIKKIHSEEMEVSNILKSVIGWEVCASLTEQEDGKTSVSLRTRNSEKYDVSKIAKALGGGGHSAAAGATINKPLTEAKEIFLSTVENLYPELGKR